MSFIGRLQGSGARLKGVLAAGAALLALGAAQAAQAYEAYVNTSAPILTGPSPDYPPVVNLYGGEQVEVYGCLDDYDWCDVSFRDYRGWMDAEQLSYPYEGRRVPLYDYGYYIGLPVLSFSLDDYWGRYYRNRPFYQDRDRWARIPPPRPREDHRRFEGGRPDFGRPGVPGGPGRPDFDRGGPVRPDFDRGQQADQQRQQQQRAAQEQQQRAQQNQQQRPQPAPQQHMQGTGDHQRYVGQGQPPRPQPAPQAAPRPAPQAAPQARPQGQPHPQGEHQGGGPGEHPPGQDNK